MSLWATKATTTPTAGFTVLAYPDWALQRAPIGCTVVDTMGNTTRIIYDRTGPDAAREYR